MIPFGRMSESLDNSCTLIAGSSAEPVMETISGENYCSDFSDLNQLWSLEMIRIRSSELDNEYDRAVEQFHQTVRYENNRVICCWPWKHKNPDLTSNYCIVRARLRSLVSSMTFDKRKFYNEIFENYLEKGILEPAPKETPNLTHYLAQISKVNQVVLVKVLGEPRASLKVGKILTLDHSSVVCSNHSSGQSTFD